MSLLGRVADYKMLHSACQLRGGDRTKRIAIYLDDVELVAPYVRSPITDDRTIITGDITPEEARMLATLLDSGVLEVPITMLEVK